MNPVGFFVPPAIIVPRNRMKLEFFKNIPEGTVPMISDSTWCVQVLRSPKEAFAAAMQSWCERCEKCLCLQSDYVEK